MTARLLPLLLLALSAAEPQHDIYKTISGKINGTEQLHPGPRFFMRDTQCLGYIPPSYLCGAGEARGVEVHVSDRVAFPMIEVHESLRNVSIARRPNAFGVCRDLAHVDTRVNCSGWSFTRSRSARPLPSKYSRND